MYNVHDKSIPDVSNRFFFSRIKVDIAQNKYQNTSCGYCPVYRKVNNRNIAKENINQRIGVSVCFVYLVIFALGISGLDLLGNEITEFILLFVFGGNVTGPFGDSIWIFRVEYR